MEVMEVTKKQIIGALEKHKKALAKERDGLRDLSSDVDELFNNADDAVRELESAIDKLSEYV